MKLFRVGLGGLLELEKDELRLIPEFKNVIIKDKGSPGDADGREKKYAFKEFAYIYHVADFAAYPMTKGLNAAEAHDYAVKEAALDQDYKPDKIVKEAIVRYRELRETTSSNTLRNLHRGLHLGDKVISKAINRLEALMNKTDTELTTEDVKILNDDLDVLIDKSTKIPKTLEVLAAVEQKVKKEVSEKRWMKGHRPVPTRADPKPKPVKQD